MRKIDFPHFADSPDTRFIQPLLSCYEIDFKLFSRVFGLKIIHNSCQTAAYFLSSFKNTLEGKGSVLLMNLKLFENEV